MAEGLTTQGGERIKVLYPGRLSSQAGPDFRDAVILTSDGRLIRGDVELHLEAPGWRHHGHHLDPRYNGVVLHVVLWPRGEVTSIQEANLEAPILALEPFLDSLNGGANSKGDVISLLTSLDEKALGGLLDRAGDERFLAKSSGMKMEMEAQRADEVLYQGLMEALGYADNRRPFRDLARRAPMQRLTSLIREPPHTRLLAIQALLLGVSGLLTRLDSGGPERELRALWRHLPKISLSRIYAYFCSNGRVIW